MNSLFIAAPLIQVYCAVEHCKRIVVEFHYIGLVARLSHAFACFCLLAVFRTCYSDILPPYNTVVFAGQPASFLCNFSTSQPDWLFTTPAGPFITIPSNDYRHDSFVTNVSRNIQMLTINVTAKDMVGKYSCQDSGVFVRLTVLGNYTAVFYLFLNQA